MDVNAVGDGGYVQAKEGDIGEYVQDLGSSFNCDELQRKRGEITLSRMPSLQVSAMVVELTRVYTSRSGAMRGRRGPYKGA
jgi:hypothetical protein